MPVSEHSKSFLPEDTDSSFGDVEDLSVNHLGDRLSAFLNVKDDQGPDSTHILKSVNNDVASVIEVGEHRDDRVNVVVQDQETDKKFELAVKTESAGSPNQPHSESGSLPTPLKLVSAMKGSREKLGIAPKKLTVKWAADVYDPPPSSVSHVPTNKGLRHRNNNKRSGKNKQKGSGKSSRGNKGRDKKHAAKHAGSSNRSFKSLDNDMTVGSSKLQPSVTDFEIGSPELFCGSSFLKRSVNQLRFPVTEAT